LHVLYKAAYAISIKQYILLKEKGLFGNVFTFIDASALISKTALWEERDKTIKDGAETLNNTNVSDYAVDKDAKWGT